MMMSRYAEGWRALHAAAPELRSERLLFRLVAWRLCRMTGVRPVIRLHDRSRMRLDAAPREQGIRAAIFLLRDSYEPSVRAAIDRFALPGETCYDIGANLGLWSLRMAERVGSAGRIVAFEALPATAAMLAKNVALSSLDNVEVAPVALGAETGQVPFYVAPDIGRSGLTGESRDDTPVRVPMRRLDDVWEEQGRPRVRFVKMDVEGAELLVLLGGARFFGETRPITCCEVNPPKLREMGFSPAQLLDCFSAWRYHAFVWSEPKRALIPYVAPSEPDAVEDLVFIPD